MAEQHLPEGVVPVQWKDGTVTYNFNGQEYASLKDVPAPSWDWLNKFGEGVQQTVSKVPGLAQGLKVLGDVTTMPGEDAFAEAAGRSAQMWGVPHSIGKTMGYLAYPGPGELKAFKGMPPTKPTGLVPVTVGVDTGLTINKTRQTLGTAKPLQMVGKYPEELQGGVKPGDAYTPRNKAWSAEQRRKVDLAVKKKKYDRAYNWLSTWAPWDPNIYGNRAKTIEGHAQHHKFTKYASAAFILRMMELANKGKADLDDILNLHGLAYKYELPMGGGRWAIQDVKTDPHIAGHWLAKKTGMEFKGKPFDKISENLLKLDTPEEVAAAMVDFIQTQGKPSLDAMLNLEKEYNAAFKSLNPEQLRKFIFNKAANEAELLNQGYKSEP